MSQNFSRQDQLRSIDPFLIPFYKKSKMNERMKNKYPFLFFYSIKKLTFEKLGVFISDRFQGSKYFPVLWFFISMFINLYELRRPRQLINNPILAIERRHVFLEIIKFLLASRRKKKLIILST